MAKQSDIRRFLPVRRQPAAPQAPPEAEIREAIANLRAPGNLCYARLRPSNRGFSIELSFNAASSVTASGALEVILRHARIELSSPEGCGDWEWDEDLKTAAKDLTTREELTVGATNSQGAIQRDGWDARVGGKGKLNGVIGSAEITTEVHQSGAEEVRNDNSRNMQVKSQHEHQPIETERLGEGAFTLILTARPNESLRRLNQDFAHLPLITTAAAAADLDQVQVDLVISRALDGLTPADGGEVRHAFLIERATGLWRPLKDRPNAQALAELLLSKFLPDLHASERLLPKGAE